MRRSPLPLRLAATAGVVLVLFAAATILRAAVGGPSASPPTIRTGAGGDLSISNSKQGTAIFRVANLGPGGSGEGGVIVGNSGTIPGALSLAAVEPSDAPGLYGGTLSTRIHLRVVDLQKSVDVYSGTLTAMPSLDLGVLDPGEEQAYLFVVEMADGGPPSSPYLDDNLYQRAGTNLGYEWTLAEVEAGGPEAEERPQSPAVEPPPEIPRHPRPPREPHASRNRVGTPHSDALLGDARANTLSGGAGSDMILGMGGGDRLLGGRGADWLDSGRGHDHLRAGPGADVIHSRDGEADAIDCGAGVDSAYVDGRDRLRSCEHIALG